MSRNFYTAQSTIIVEMQEKERKRNMDEDESKLCDYHEYFFIQRKKKKNTFKLYNFLSLLSFESFSSSFPPIVL